MEQTNKKSDINIFLEVNRKVVHKYDIEMCSDATNKSSYFQVRKYNIVSEKHKIASFTFFEH